MKSVKMLLLIVFAMIAEISYSQIEAKRITYIKGKCYYQNNIYSPKTIQEVIKSNGDAFGQYKKYKKLKRRVTTLGILSLVLAGGGVALASYDKEESEYFNCDDFCPDEFVRFWGHTALVSSATALITSLVKQSKSKKFLKKSIDVFNAGNQSPDLGVAPIELKIGNTQNGVGAVLSF